MSKCDHLGFVYFNQDEGFWYCARCNEQDIDEPANWTYEEIAEAKGIEL